MFIQEVIIDGFKSYATRTVVSGFDPRFNAITGLNGSGKSNILDAICFVLGISNLSQVRASNLQELVYKQGQAGVSKASVTIVFNNTEPEQSPVGYEHCDTITVTRQIAIGGRNKYLINGHTATATRVQNLFHSVQLNVNNPHFLIMQGRITKVLNMKPPEILGMIEEAAGTRMFESKKLAARKTIEKKQSKVDEINKILSEEITPTLERLREERSHYLRWAANNTECERLARFCIAFDFLDAEQRFSSARRELEDQVGEEKRLEGEAAKYGAEAEELGAELERLEAQRADSLSGEYKRAQAEEEELSKQLVRVTSEWQNKSSALQEDRAQLTALTRQLEETRETRDGLRAKLEEHARARDTAQAEAARASEAVAKCQRALHAARSGMAVDDSSGATDSMVGQITALKQSAKEADAEAHAAERKVEYLQQVATETEAQLSHAEDEFASLQQAVDDAINAVTVAKDRVAECSFSPDEEARARASVESHASHVARLEERVEEALSATNGAGPLELEYDRSRLGRDWDDSRVKGVVARLVRVEDTMAATALEVAAGGKLYQVVVDTEETGQRLLQRGQLRRRVTIIPLNRIRRSTLREETVERARKVSRGKAVPALSLVGYDDEVASAMEFVFGQHFVCPDAETAQRVTFDDRIKALSVTLDGDVFDPVGTLEGGARPRTGGVLLQLERVAAMQDELQAAKEALAQAQTHLDGMQTASAEHSQLRSELELAEHRRTLAEQRRDRSSFADLQRRAETARNDAISEGERATAARSRAEECRRKASELEARVASGDAESAAEAGVKEAEAALQHAKQHASEQSSVAKEATQVADATEAELAAAEAELASAEDGKKKAESSVASLERTVGQLDESVASLREQYDAAHAALESERAAIAETDAAVKRLMEARSTATKKSQTAETERKRLDHRMRQLRKDATHAEKWVRSMAKKHPWIEQERGFFGQAGTDYDFSDQDVEQVRQRLQEMEKEQEQLSQKLNKKVMGMIETAEKEYQELRRKRDTIRNDKKKIEDVIEELEEKKNDALRKTWTKVNRDFGSIFSTLLPGTSAKLDPPEGGSVLDGLEVRVAFNGIWKESLSELSGGQRSLLALSLILSLLLFKPAPMYILDEVDAALDLSHTQNIGHMLRTHFAHSQFIVVSLKQGMFNNANVVYRTKFVDGVSTVTRTVPSQSARAALADADAADARAEAEEAAAEAEEGGRRAGRRPVLGELDAGPAAGGGGKRGRRAGKRSRGEALGEEEGDEEEVDVAEAEVSL